KAFNDLGDRCHEAGPLDEKSRRLVKLALSIGAGLEGATHSAVRSAARRGSSKKRSIMWRCWLSVLWACHPPHVPSHGFATRANSFQTDVCYMSPAPIPPARRRGKVPDIRRPSAAKKQDGTDELPR